MRYAFSRVAGAGSKYITSGMEITAIGGGRAGTKVFYNFISIRLPTSER